jgi:hypothetical protein
MKSLKRRIGIAVVSMGFDPRRLIASLRFIVGYFFDLWRWLNIAPPTLRAEFPLRLLPTLSDKYGASGVVSGHYFHQDLWVARLIYDKKPARHIDIGSRIDGFVAHLLCFMEVEVLDIRVLSSKVSGLIFRQANLMSETQLPIDPAPSVSCLHALEHFGLGRYGDPLQPDGWRTGFARLVELVEPDGVLYLGVPIGSPAVEFNAQRIFHPNYILHEAKLHGLVLHAWACVDDAGDLEMLKTPVKEEQVRRLATFEYGCGLFVFVKASSQCKTT